MTFASPWSLLLLLVVVPMWHVYRRPQRRSALRFPGLSRFRVVLSSRWSWLAHVPFALRVAAVVALCFALARPQITLGESKKSSEGLDIVLAIDTSGSMQALDFEIKGERHSRLEVVKSVIADFIKGRPDDRIGLVVFGESAFMQAPLTLDHRVMESFLDRIKIGMAGGDRTAIGDGLGVAVKRLKDIPAKSKIIILLTDGQNNAGVIPPATATEIAKSFGIKVYTIGAGTKGRAPIPQQTIFGPQIGWMEVDIDEDTLKKMADETGGQYFRATDTKGLTEIYQTIDSLEKTKIDVKVFRNAEEACASFLWPALGFLVLEALFGLTRFRRLW